MESQQTLNDRRSYQVLPKDIQRFDAVMTMIHHSSIIIEYTLYLLKRLFFNHRTRYVLLKRFDEENHQSSGEAASWVPSPIQYYRRTYRPSTPSLYVRRTRINIALPHSASHRGLRLRGQRTEDK
jgi:hypothetical protein